MCYVSEISSARFFIDFMFSSQDKISLLYDTGANLSLLSLKSFEKAKRNGRVLREIKNHSVQIKNASGRSMKVSKVVEVACKYNGRNFVAAFVICPDLPGDGIVGMNIIKEQKLAIDLVTDKIDFVSKITATDVLEGQAEVRVMDRISIPPRNGRKVRCGLYQGQTKVLGKHDIFADFKFITNATVTDEFGNFIIYVPNNDTFNPFTLERGEIIGSAEDAAQFATCSVSVAVEAVANCAGEETIRSETMSTAELHEAVERHLQKIPQEQRGDYRAVLLGSLGAFSKGKFDLGFTDRVSHNIELKDRNPVYTQQFRLPTEHLKTIKENVMAWMKIGIVERARSKYNSPIFCVPKKEGQGLRTVLDYRNVNMKSMPDRYSIRTIEECITEVGHADSKVFSCLDLVSGFWQMNLDEECRKYTAFTIPGCGQFQWRTSPMGLAGCPASFSRLMEVIMQGAENVITYIDDVLIHSKDHKEHLGHLEGALKRIEKSGLKLNLAKCIFGAQEVSYLGHTLTSDGIKPGKDKAAAIGASKPPRDVKQVKSFVGLCNYFRNYIDNFAIRAAPLFALTRQDCQWKGGELPAKAMASFLDLRKAISSSPVLAYPAREGEFQLFVDAAQGDECNEGGLGAVLLQKTKTGEKRVIGYASRRLEKHEKNYPAFLLELAAAVYGMDYFEVHLRGRRFGLYTDHKPLTKLSTIHKKTLPTLQLKLQSMHPDIRYVAGKENNVADFLSRYAGMGGVNSIEISDFKLVVLQKRDKVLSDLREKVLQEQAKMAPGEPEKEIKVQGCTRPLKVVKDVLLAKMARETPNAPHGPWRVVVPQSMKSELLREAHNSSIAGHGGQFRTMERLRSVFWWPNMTEDVAQHVKQCQTCQKVSTSGTTPPAPLEPLPVPSKTNERIHIDLFGPLKSSQAGNTYVLVITDALTKLVRLFAAPDKEAATVARLLLDGYIYIHGVPKSIQSDGGKEFCNELQTALWKSLDIEHAVITPHHPQTNAQVEIFNKTMAKYLRTAIEDGSDTTLDWELYLGPLMFSYNTAVHKSTTISPFYATFGYDPRVPLWETPEQLLAHDGGIKQPKAANALNDIRKAQWMARRVAHHKGQVAKEAQKEAFDKHYKAEMPSYMVGDPVWVKRQPTPGQNAKLEAKWEAGVIVEQLRPAVFRVRRTERTRKQVATMNIQQLKPRLVQDDGHDMDDQSGDDDEMEAPETLRRTTRSMTKSFRTTDPEEVGNFVAEIMSDFSRHPTYELWDLLRKGYQIYITGLGSAAGGTAQRRGLEEQNDNDDNAEDQARGPQDQEQEEVPEMNRRTLKIPRALKRLASFNKPGRKDRDPTPDTDDEDETFATPNETPDASPNAPKTREEMKQSLVKQSRKIYKALRRLKKQDKQGE